MCGRAGYSCAKFGRRLRAARGHGRIVALTSDHVAGNLPTGAASKDALDRIVLAAAVEFRDLGICGERRQPWADRHRLDDRRPDRGFPPDAPRGGRAWAFRRIAPNLVRFLCSADGGWINGQLLHSNGGHAVSVSAAGDNDELESEVGVDLVTFFLRQHAAVHASDVSGHVFTGSANLR